MKQQTQIIHYPSLKTVLMVEEAIKNSNTLLTREGLKRKLKKQVMHQTLNIILEYLEKSGKILDGHKGIAWTQSNSPYLKRALRTGMEL